ncbi:hypothetical protein [Flavobacterium sp.]|uniref:hypothetical protein n=1 Tax=Flavobacterium sp. TaxID=239 RepID=UPI00262F9F4B|nr:hypothetical protein [Flavobacterium sp.]
MRTKALIFSLLLSTAVFAQSKFETGMKKGMELWNSGKTTEASALFERIAAAEPNEWLPNYYVALVNTTSAFYIKDKTQITALLTQAQNALDIEMAKNAENAELLVVQALIYTAYIVQDPMTNGQKYSPIIMGLYAKAEKLAPENPRVVFSKADFEIGGAKFWGKDTKPMCEQVARSIAMFENEKPATPFAPTWGKERAEQVLASCGK